MIPGSDESPFLTPAPEVEIEAALDHPYENAVAAARTCYSSRGIVTVREVSGADLDDPVRRSRKEALRDSIARSIYKAGHHTTLQHAHVQFRISGVSRQFVWSFLHSHPFYNSEQVSQRYVEVRPENVVVPRLEGEALGVYESAVRSAMESYARLVNLLEPAVDRAYFEIFPARKGNPRYQGEVRKRAQEVARYVLPLGTTVYLYHTVSVVTLFRYWRVCLEADAPSEQRFVVGKMVRAILCLDPQLEKILEEPLAPEEFPEDSVFGGAEPRPSLDFRRAFDAALEGKTSRLIDWKARNEEVLADSVREVLGLEKDRLGDEQAIACVLDPARNSLLGNSLNLGMHSKLMRALVHPGYTFRKKLSHAADSQDQRHRTVPASRPILLAQVDDTPDFIEPELLRREETALRAYREAMRVAWEAVGRLRRLGVPGEFLLYVLPNATSVRFTESADLSSLRHKMAMRLCYNAQEEIWKASLEEALQIREINPRIGKFLLPPCSLRLRAGAHPICPEGSRYCGVPVWRVEPSEYRRVL